MPSVTMRLSFSKHDLELWRMTMILLLGAFLFPIIDANIWRQQRGLDYDNDHKDEGDYCRIKSGKLGVCKRIEGCEIYYEGLRKKTIEYSSLVRCSIIDFTEIICCPTADSDKVWDYEALDSQEKFDLGSFRGGNVDPVTTRDVGWDVQGKADATETSLQFKKDPTTSKPEGKDVSRVLLDDDKSEQLTKRPSQAACDRYKSLDPAGLSHHILGGKKVAIGEYPHVGGLIFNQSYGPVELRCGSVLISERYVLTAAHCVWNPFNTPDIVRFGVVSWNSVVDDINPVDVEIENITLHPSYREFKHFHDIALIRLKKKIRFTPYVFPACLNSDVKDVDPETLLRVLGWGIINIANKSRSDDLLMTNVTTVPLKMCNVTHMQQNKVNLEKNRLNEGQYCAFDPKFTNDACGADSGGPLQLPTGKPATVVGVVSYGHSCATAIPSVYARVAYYLDWIESIVWPS